MDRYNPWREMATLQRSLNRLAENRWGQERALDIPLEVHETDHGYTVVAEMAGVNEDNINICMEDRHLVIEAQVAEPADEARVLVRERRYGKFHRSVQLPQPIDVEKIEAVLENGLLTLHLPKRPEVQPRRIQITSKSS